MKKVVCFCTKIELHAQAYHLLSPEFRPYKGPIYSPYLSYI